MLAPCSMLCPVYCCQSIPMIDHNLPLTKYSYHTDYSPLCTMQTKMLSSSIGVEALKRLCLIFGRA